MSMDGGDTGGGTGGDSGGVGKGGSGNSSSPDFTESGTAPAVMSSGSAVGGNAGANSFAGTDSLPNTLPPEITTGNSGGTSQSGAPSLGDFLSGPTDGDGGFNLAGPGPVGGDMGTPAVHGGVFSTDSSAVPLSQDTNALGTTAPSAGAGSTALAFAAPSGVSGTPQLDSLVSAPSGAADAAPADQSIFDSLNGAEAATANDYAAKTAPNVPTAPGESTTLPATTPSAGSSPTGAVGSAGNTNTGGGSSQTSNILDKGNLGAVAAGAGLLNNLISGNKAPPQSANLTGIANSANVTAQQQTEAGTALQQYIATGKLPAGYEDQVQQAAQAAKQTIISNYAARGLPTDPSHNSALAQELNQVDARLPAAREQIAGQLAQTGGGMVAAGLQATGISSGVFQALAGLQNDQNKQRAAAIGNFAAALNGGNKGVTLNLGTKAA